MWTWLFWRQGVERAVKTSAQAMLALITVGAVGLHDVPWLVVLSAAGLAAVASLLTSVASAGVGPAESPSVVDLERRLE